MSETLTAAVPAAVPTTDASVTAAPVAPAQPTAPSVAQKTAADLAREIMAGVSAPDDAFPGDPETPLEDASADEAAADPADAPTTDETPADAEAKADDATEKPKRALLAEFTVKDDKGEIEIPDLTLAFKANGEVREMPLDKVVKLAQQGFYNEQRQREVESLRQTVPQLEQRVTEAEQRAQFFATTWEQALASASRGDFTMLQRELDAYTQAQTPEAQLQRTQQELQQLRSQQTVEAQRSQDTQSAQQFAGALQSTFDALAQQHPDVSHEEILGKFSTLTAPLMQGGRLPPSAFQRAAELVAAELVPFVESRQHERTAVVARAKQTADATIAQHTAQAKAQEAAAKRTLARVTKPTASASAGGGSMGTSPGSSPTPSAPKTAQDALATILADVRQQANQPAMSGR